MTVGTPSWLNASGGQPTYDAVELRALDSALSMYSGNNLGSRPGVRPGGTSAQISVSGMTWSVATGVVIVNAVSSGQLGEYRVPITAAETGTIPARDATFDRKDILVVTVKDADAGDSTREAIVQYITGTPNSTPAAPSVPPRSQLLGTITVPKASPGNAITWVQSNQFTVAAGGILPTPTQPTASERYPGMLIYNLTNGLYERWNGTNWEDIRGGAWPTYAVTWSQSTGAVLSIGNGTLEGRYTKHGRDIHGTIQLVRGSTSNVGSANYQFSAPETPRSYGLISGTGIAIVAGAAIPCIVQGIAPDGTFALVRTDTRARIAYNTGSWTTGDSISIDYHYEAAS